MRILLSVFLLQIFQRPVEPLDFTLQMLIFDVEFGLSWAPRYSGFKPRHLNLGFTVSAFDIRSGLSFCFKLNTTGG